MNHEFAPGQTGVTDADIVGAFGAATRRAIEAGFDGVKVHGAYGYLPQQFFSPYTNPRGDRWDAQPARISLERSWRFVAAEVANLPSAGV